ncbi:MAG: hypothetical protein ACRDYZ_04450 [Acidimicrobiales bacterium]
MTRVAALQASGPFLERGGCVEQVIGGIEQAGAQGVELLAFPESFIPGHPLANGGGAGVVGAKSRQLTGPLAGDHQDQVVAGIDLCQCIEAKVVHDYAGHYERPDVFALIVRPGAEGLVVEATGDGPPGGAGGEPSTGSGLAAQSPSRQTTARGAVSVRTGARSCSSVGGSGVDVGVLVSAGGGVRVERSHMAFSASMTIWECRTRVLDSRGPVWRSDHQEVVKASFSQGAGAANVSHRVRASDDTVALSIKDVVDPAYKGPGRRRTYGMAS